MYLMRCSCGCPLSPDVARWSLPLSDEVKHTPHNCRATGATGAAAGTDGSAASAAVSVASASCEFAILILCPLLLALAAAYLHTPLFV